MKKIRIVLFVWLCGINIFYAQQEASFNQYTLESSVINPAYATSDYVKSFGVSGKNQPGNINNPKSFMAFGHFPINDNSEASFRISSDDIGNGIVNQKTIAFNYAYVLDLDNDETKLSYGISAGVNGISSKFEDLILEQGTVYDDRAFVNAKHFSPVVGVGVFYYKKNMYVGFSIPNLLKSDNLYTDNNKITVYKKSDKYLAAGYVFDLTYDIKIRPSVLIKYNEGIVYPNVMLNALFFERFEMGFMYKHTISNNVLAGFKINDKIRINISYEMLNNKIGNLFSNATEIGISYRIFETDFYDNIINPRYY